MKRLIFIITLLYAISAQAQTVINSSPFKHLPKPAKKYGLPNVQAANPTVIAYRFTGPLAGYMYPQKQVVTGIGYGYQRLHYVDSTQRYYTDFSVSGMLYAGGNVATVNNTNIISVGLSIGVLNQLIMFGGAYNLPSANNSKGSFGLVFNIAVPLN